MTSRTPMGVQPPRPPQRSLSSGLTVQRPPHQRALSAQYLPQSPVRRDNLIDLTADANDAAVSQNRYGTMPRHGGSRLKLELSSETAAAIFQPLAADSPQQTLTPSRVMPKTDASSAADVSSPASNKAPLAVDVDNRPMPMPKRRQRFTLPPPTKITPTPTIVTKKDGRPKPYTTEVPSAAPRYAPLHKKPDGGKTGFGSAQATRETQEMGHADFFPWTGNHAEDQLSDTIVKQGFFDKAPAPQSETTSAKQAIFPALKHKNGLHLLSSIFIGVMGQRKHNGQVTAPSAFKPPPRVTLTDTKREVWMRDLANPAISLRRLSRTIPHGIRGKGLLDHCLNKHVPTERAVWLVRCVGANDLRTVKRKGVNGAVVMGGEAKWLKDWTIFVEQFVESVTSAFGDADWKTKFQYAIRLATHLYAESLVDRDHYMDWLVSGLENASQVKLPMWILISQIYWKDMLRLRRYGRRLVAALLTHLNVVYQDPDRDVLSQLSDRLTALLVPLLIHSPDNFLAPTTWLKCREALSAYLPIHNDAAHAAYSTVNSRNEQLLASSSKSQPANRQILIKHLDSTLQTLYANELPSTCWAVSDDKRMIMRTVLEWSTSIYRPGQAKVYVAASLLRAWANMNIDTTRAILDFLDSSPPQEASSKRWFYHLVSELTRTGHFSTHGYTLWLISRGGVRTISDTEPDAPCTTRLLVELPLHGVDTSFTEIRSQLLRRASYNLGEETDDIVTALKVVQHALGVSFGSQDAMSQKKPLALNKICRAISNSSRTLQTEVGLQLMNLVGSGTLHISPDVFSFVRSVLHAAADFSSMAHVIKAVIKSSDAELLASCADTVNVHLPVFAALGAGRDLCDMLLDRMKAMSDEHGFPARPLLVSLSSLAGQVPGLSNTAAHLRKELQQSDRSTAIDACSPVSDNMPMRLQDAESELAEEIEKLLANGSSVDRPTMDRLFHTIVSRLESSWTTAPDKQRAFSALLARLRVFDRQHFDLRMTDWVHHVSSLAKRPTISSIYPGLISLGCLAFSTIFTTTSLPDVASFAAGPVPQGCASAYMQEVLQMVTTPLPARTAVTPEEAYRFYIEQRLAPQKHHKELLSLVRNALLEYSRLQRQGTAIPDTPLGKDDVRNQMLELLRTLILADSQSAAQTLGLKLPDSPLAAILANTTTRLLAPARDADEPMTFETVLEMANDFALPFCQLKLSIGLVPNRAPNPGGSEEQPSQVDMLSKALNQAVDTKNMMWTSILPYLSEDITEHLKRQTQNRFLSLFPSSKASETASPGTQDDNRLTASLLSVVESIIQGRPALKSSQLNPTMVDKLAELWEVLASTDADKREVRAATLQHWLPALLKFITLHTTPNEAASPTTPAPNNMKPPTSAVATETRARMLVVLAGLTLELQGLAMEEASKYGDLREAVFDLALLLIDNLPEEARLQCVRLVITGGGSSQGSGSSDARLRYLFSSAPAWKEQFMLAHRQTQTSTPASRMRPHISVQQSYKLTPYIFRKWELLSEPSPVVGENDTALSLTLFEAIKIQ